MTLNVFYTKKNNMGDLLNEYIIPEVTGLTIAHSPKCNKFEIMGIGSCMGAIWGNIDNKAETIAKDFYKTVTSSFSRNKCAVWGTGFIKDLSGRKLRLLRKNTEFIAVRGNLTKAIVEKSLGKSIDPVLCDGGILSSLLVDTKTPKKYSVGFIPHFKERELCKRKGFWELYEDASKDSTVIDLTDNPIDVLKKIASCEVIVSSSLHGCICADSFHIPNTRIKISDIPGSGFKFDDYYSCYGKVIPAVNVIEIKDFPTTEQIISEYQISCDEVEKKKTEMTECLLQFLNRKGQ